MKIKSIRKTGPELYLVTFKKWWSSREFQRHVIVDKAIYGDPVEEHQLIVYRDSDELAHDCRPHVEWMIRNGIEFFDNFPKNGINATTLLWKDQNLEAAERYCSNFNKIDYTCRKCWGKESTLDCFEEKI